MEHRHIFNGPRSSLANENLRETTILFGNYLQTKVLSHSLLKFEALGFTKKRAETKLARKYLSASAPFTHEVNQTTKALSVKTHFL